jgi:hypothetical protein
MQASSLLSLVPGTFLPFSRHMLHRDVLGTRNVPGTVRVPKLYLVPAAGIDV